MTHQSESQDNINRTTGKYVLRKMNHSGGRGGEKKNDRERGKKDIY